VIAASRTAAADEALREYDRLTRPMADAGWSLPLPVAVSRTLMRVPVVARLVLDRWFLRTAA
jgi:hypothetical protein